MAKNAKRYCLASFAILASRTSPGHALGQRHLSRPEGQARRFAGFALTEKQNRPPGERETETGCSERFVRRTGFVEAGDAAVAIVKERVDADRHPSDEQPRACPEIAFRDRSV